jgi:hypothetical protein
MRTTRWIAIAMAWLIAAALSGAAVASASTTTKGSLVQVSGGSPIPEACIGDTDASASSVNVYNSEVEPWLAVDPSNPLHMVGTWQQDRWNNGGSRGDVTAASFDGGATWSPPQRDTKSTVCTGGEDYERASDPWVVIAPDGSATDPGTTYLMTLSVDTNPGGFGLHPNAMLAMRSPDGGLTWDDPVTLKRDENPNVLNDKNSMTADPFDSNYVYAVWDRLVVPPTEAPPPQSNSELAIGYRGPAWFARTTDGGETWEPAREIYDPGTQSQTIGNQIAVTGAGDLVNAFDLIRDRKNVGGGRGFNIAVLRSEDRGETWDQNARIVDHHFAFQGMVVDPDDGDPVRTGDILPEIATDLNDEDVYLVWQDMRFGTLSSVAFSQSSDGGKTWSDTVKINKTPDLPGESDQAFTPMVRVADDGTVTVTYYDFRNNTTDPDTLPTDAWAIHCHAADVDCSDPDNWTDEVRLTDRSFDMEDAPVARGFFVGDYVGLDTDGINMFPFWSMPAGGDPANIYVRALSPAPGG